MTRSKSPLVAQIVLMTFVLDSALAARVAPTPSMPRVAGSHVASPRAASFSPPAGTPSAPAAVIEECEDALADGRAPVTSLSRTFLWPPNHDLIDVGLAVDPTPECAGLVDLEVAVWSDEPDDDHEDASFDVPDLYLRADRMGGGNGRVYLVITRASTGAAEGVSCRTVVVPHSGSSGSMNAVNAQAAAARATCAATGTAPPSYFLLAEAGFSQANHAPTVSAGPDQGVAIPGTATLDGAASDDGLPDGHLGLEWTQVSGPGQAAFSNANLEDPVVTFPAPGSYTLRLTARDGQLESQDDVVVILEGANEAPHVGAGDDQSLVLPASVAALQGTATDDGRPNTALTVSWTVVTVPAGGSVAFSAPSALATLATLSTAGDYVIRLTAHDGQLSSSDDVTVTLHPEAPPILSVSDRTVPEGNDGRAGAELLAALSRPWSRPVTVDFMTSDGSATAHCDYTFRYGTVTFDPGQTQASVLVPVMGELAPEAAETVLVRLGNVTEAILAGDQAILTITDDDAANEPPTAHASRSPANLATGVTLPPTLSWLSSDPDPGDGVVHDIYLGTAANLEGQSWGKVCPAAPGPGPSPVFGFDDAADRMVVLEQMADGSTGSRVWVLGNATGAGGPSQWTSFETSNNPHVVSARAGYDTEADQLIVVGRCAGTCGGGIQTWILANASGNGVAEWRQVAVTSAPPENTRFALAHSEASNRLFLFGGMDASGVRLGDLWRLDDATGAASWTRLEPAGERPSPRDAASLVIDHRRNRLLLFGGGTSDTTATNEVWALDGLDSVNPTWQRIETDQGPAPAPRFGHAGLFDAGTGRLLVFGGSTPGLADNSNFVFGDAWLLDGVTWTRVSVPAPVPAGRFDATVAFSPSANRLIVGAGENNKLAVAPADLWVLSDAMGGLSAVALGQGSASYVPEGLDPSAAYLWRIVTRDTRGAWRGSPTWTFTANRPPLVNAGADEFVELPPGTVTLAGSATDDGLPASGPLTMQWRMVTGPAAVSFSGGQSPVATATFTSEGTYVLRLAASDGALDAHDDLTVVVEPPNAPPSVDAGVDQTVALPQTTASLTGTVADDGRPAGGTLSAAWSQLGGPAQVTFADPAHPATPVTLGPAGVYLLRLTASDGRATVFDDVTVTVTPANGAPQVDAGPDQAITLPADTAILAGTVVDDGRPFGTLTHAWSQLSGPAAVMFGAPAAPVTAVTFTQLGAYRLRLSVGDGQLSADDEVRVVVGSASVLPDLVVERVDAGGLVVDPSTLAMTGTIVAVGANPGPGAVAGAFAITFFEDRNRSGVFESAHDLVLGTAAAGALGPGETFAASAAVSGTAAFSGNLVYAFADSGAAIVEANEGNNYGSSAPVCAFTPPVRTPNPTQEWTWTGSAQVPLSRHPWGSPLVIDLDLDRTPEILFLTNKGNGLFDYAIEGSLRAVNGADHFEVFTTNGIDHGLNSLGQMAAGNIDADPYPEIIAAAQDRTHWIAFEHDGTFKWISASVDELGWGAVALADLEGDGVAEIVFGRQVLNADGTLRWTGTGGRGQNGPFGPTATVVDLDLDGRPEIVAGNTAYRGQGPQQGQILWQRTSAPGGTVGDGFTAVANFDADPNPEIVLVALGVVWMLEHDGTVKWGPITIPGGAFFGGPPVIGNLDGDPEREFVVVGRERFVAFEGDGTVAWTAPSPTLNREAASAALFDFDGDGAAEVVYNDDHSLRIFGGGQVLFEAPTWGWTARGSPVIADADGDGKAEIVITDSGSRSTVPGASALRVFGDAADTWLLSRPLWNQAEYHISNVNDDGSIPAVETRPLDSSRQNALVRVSGGTSTPGCAYAKADLTASFLRVAWDATSARLTARVGNGGAAVAGFGLPVTFYDGDPAAGSPRLGTVHTVAVMAPGAYEDVSLALPAAATTSRSIWIVADDYGNLRGMTTESNEDNNAYDSGQALLGPFAGVDLVVTEVDVSGIVTDPATLQVSGAVRATIRNQGNAAATGAFVVAIFEDTNADGLYSAGTDVLLGQAAHDGGLGAREDAAAAASVGGQVRFAGNVVHAMVDSAAAILETDETNNAGRSGDSCRVVPPVGTFTPVIERRWTTSPTQPTSTNVAATPLVADLDGDGFADVVFVTFIGNALTTSGRLRAISGRDGHELFTITDPAHALAGWGNLALGDIDGDARPEIVAVHQQRRLIAFEHDGAFKWLSPPLLNIDWGGPSIADLDGDGTPEIVLGRQALRADDGSIAWTALGGNRGGNGGGTFATVADLDLDGAPEVLVGPAAYSNGGVLRWADPLLPDGHTAVANFDSDPFPEIVLVGGNRVWLLEHTGAVRWGPVTLPGAGGMGSAPVISDFDADGRPEIGVGNWQNYTVIETSGLIRWSVATSQPASSTTTGVSASAFDFDGDGAAEIVYSDESGLKVRRGFDGALLAEHPVPSCLLGRGYPVVADVDGDGNAEIVAPANATCSASMTPGIAIIGDLHDRWVTARPLWNQFDYRIDNVLDDAAIPSRAAPMWPGSSVRANRPGAGSRFQAPDLRASFIRRAEDGTDLVFTIRVGNAGAGAAGPGVPVSLYNGDPRLGFLRVATVATGQLLRPGAFEDVVFRVASATAAEDRIFFGVDRHDGSASTVSECNEDDNLVGTVFYLNRRPVADAGTDSAITSPQEIALLSGTGSDDGLPLGSTLEFLWEYLGGPVAAPPPIANPTALTTTVRLGDPGLYFFRLTASDSARAFTDIVVVTLHPANQPPVVDAGADQVLVLPDDTAVLTGTVSDDGRPIGGSLTYQWAVAGPGTVAFIAPTAISTTARFPSAGTYRLSLTASDGGLTATDEVEVIVDPVNVAPTANAGPDQVLAGNTGQMGGAAADDGLPRGGTLAIAWSLVEGAGTVTWADVHDLDTAVEFSADGLYLLRLTTTDGALFAHDDVVVRVNPTNLPPVVDAGPDQALSTAGTVLAATVADDGLPVGGLLTVTWSMASGPGHVSFADLALPTTAVSFSADGDYVLRFAATDSALQASDTVVVGVAAGNHAPFVDAGPDQTLPAGVFGTSVAGEIADDGIPVGAVLAYSWTQVGGPSAAVFDAPSSPSATATFGGPGAYVLRLTVSDSLLAASDDVAVQVGAAAPSGPPPTASLTSPAPGHSLGQPTMVRGSVASGALASWRLEHRLAGESAWTRFGFGTTTVTDGDLAAFDPTLLLNGLHQIRLVATDTAGRFAQATTQVVVRDNFKVGHFTVSFVDVEVPVAGIPIQVGRTYDSRDKRAGDFGRGWRLDMSNVRVEETGVAGSGWVATRSFGNFPTYCLQAPSPKVVAVTLPNGLVFEFEAVITPSCRAFVPPDEVTFTYRPRPGTQGTLVPVNGAVAAALGAWPEAGGSASMQLFRVTDYTLFDPAAYELTLPDGRAFVLSQAEGLQRITDRSGNVLNVSRNGITHSSGRGVIFIRNGAGAITSVTDPEGRTTEYAYLSSGDLESVTDREGHATRFRYHPLIAHHLESIQDPLGRTPLRNEYDEDGRLERHVDALGKVIEYTHSIGARQEIVKDRNDKQRVLEYDERGNVQREIDPTGKVVVRTFDARNKRLTETAPHVPGTPNVPATAYVYDADDNVTKVTDAENHRTEYTYNARRQVRTTKDALDRVTENTYDPVTGNLLTTKDALNQVMTYTYDGHGNVETQTVTVDGTPHVTRYAYDSHGTLTRETDALGHETNFTHDANGNRLTQTTTRGIYTCTAAGCTQTSVQTLTTTYVYDLAGRLTETRNPDGTSTRTVYDEMGRQKETYDALGHRTAFVYDEMGRLTRTTFVDGTSEESTYDNEGRRLTSKDREGRITSYAYDDVGRLTRTTFPDTTFAESTYDDAGRLVASRDARGKTTTYGYDRAGRRTRVRDPMLNETTFGYDANGNQTMVRDALGRTTTYEYDALNRRTKTIFPDLSFTSTTYDALGRRRSETDQAGKTTSFAYDRVGRLVLVRDAAGKETTYTYDEVGNRIAQRDANGRLTAFEYDVMGRETARILPDGARETREYDSGGNVRQRTDFRARTTTYAYDATNRLTSRTYTDADQNVSFTYTPSGRRLTASDARGVTSYGYDVRQRLASLTYPDGRRLEYAYDASGNRASLTARLGTRAITTGFIYDDAGRLDVVTDPLGREYDHAYDANGNRDSLAYPNGTVTDYTYNTLNRLTVLATTHPASARTIQSYAFMLGPAGNRTAISESDGTVRAYTYDDLYRLTGERVTVGVPLEYEKLFGYDDVGNRLTQVTVGSGAPGTPLGPGSLGYAYDTRDRLLTETLGGNPPTSFGYDANGNLVTRSSEATYTWDFENRLTRVAKTDGTTVEHAYDADGNRVQTRVTPATGPPVVTNFLVDTSGSLSHVVAETDEGGALQAYYVRADDLLAVMRPVGPTDWTTRFVHADGIGSIRRLTDEAALITDGYTYTAFGELIAHTGTDAQPYAFAGEPYDPNSAFQYHRARWMDPKVGRFGSIDPWRGNTFEPASLHRYIYASANPVSRVDPSGLISWWVVSRFVGREVHAAIGFDFETRRRGAFTNDFSISTVLGMDRSTCQPAAAFCDRQPDLADGLGNPAPEVYEIKAEGVFGEGYAAGFADMLYYLTILNINDPQGRVWRPGTTFIPRPVFYVPSWGGWLIFPKPPRTGVIVYEAKNLPATIATMVTVGVLMASSRQGVAVSQAIGFRLAFGGPFL